MTRALTTALATIGIFALTAASQPGPARRYDPSTVQTISGEVLRIDHLPGRRGTGTVVHLALRVSPAETLDVRLGPAWFVDGQKMRIKENDRVQVKGSRVTIAGAPVVIAAVITKNDKTMVLRNDAGVPSWAGQKAHARQ